VRDQLPAASALHTPRPFIAGSVTSLAGIGDLEAFARFVPVLCGPGIIERLAPTTDVLRPCQHEKLARGAQDKEHAMSQKLNSAIAVIGIDIGTILHRAVPAYSEITWSSRWLCSAIA
jgi:hypothetical protein